MERIEPQTDLEIQASNEAISNIRWNIARIKKEEEFLKNKKFHLGDIVIHKEASFNDRIFTQGVKSGSVGKIVGWEPNYGGYYRVFYSDEDPYLGVKEDNLESFQGEVPPQVLEKDPYDFLRY